MINVIYYPFSDPGLMIRIRFQASGSDYDPSLVTETLREIQNSDTASEDINLLKDVAAQTYMG